MKMESYGVGKTCMSVSNSINKKARTNVQAFSIFDVEHIGVALARPQSSHSCK